MMKRNAENREDSQATNTSLFQSLWLFCPEAISFLSACSAQHAVVEGQTHHGLLVAAVLPLDLARLHAPQAGQVV